MGMQQGKEPGVEEGEGPLQAFATVLVVVIVVVVVILGFTYLGGWAAHVLVDVARSGWSSK